MFKGGAKIGLPHGIELLIPIGENVENKWKILVKISQSSVI